MDVKDIRNELMRQSALHEQSVLRSQEAVKTIAESLSQITPEMIESCEKIGVNLNPLLQADLEKAINDSEYRDKLKGIQEDVITKLHSYLESNLCSR